MSRSGLLKTLVAGFFGLALITPCAGAGEMSIGKGEIGGTVGLFSATGDGGFTRLNAGGSIAGRVGTNGQIFGEFGLVPLEAATTSGSASGVSYTGSGSARMYNYLAGLRYHLGSSSKALPYIVVLGGIGRTVVSANATASVGSVTGTGSYSESINSGIYGFGGGVRCLMGSRVGVRPEVRYQRHQYSEGGGNAIVATVSLFFQFGGGE